MSKGKDRLCPVSNAWGLDNAFRRMVQNPAKILSPYVKEGMTALDIGCGPGFFTLAMAEMVGESGRVIAADLQEGMLKRLDKKIRGSRLEKSISLHRCEKDRLGITEQADFALAFYMVHEVPDREAFFSEMFSVIRPGGRVLIVEPSVFHVSKMEFEDTIKAGKKAGFNTLPGPGVLFGRTAILERPQ